MLRVDGMMPQSGEIDVVVGSPGAPTGWLKRRDQVEALKGSSRAR
jgi:hypothetical protein